MTKPKKDCSADFHRARRKQREEEKKAEKDGQTKPVDLTRAPDKIGEGPDHARKRSDYFKKRRGL